MSFDGNRYRGAALAEHHREMIRQTGKTNFGKWVWTMEEDRALREFHPNYSKLKKLLPRRSRIAIKQHAIKIGKRKLKPRSMWTANEVRRLRLRWRDASKQELLEEFPRHSWSGLTSKANKLRLYRRRRPPKQTGRRILDEVRNRAAALRISLSELDRICGAGNYFMKSHSGSQPSRNIWPKAIAALGGRIEIVWR